MAVTMFVHGVVLGTDGQAIPFGSPSTPVQITLGSGLTMKRDVSVAQNTTATLFNTTNDLSDFDFLVITATVDMYLELTTDLDNSVGDEVYTIPLLANVPFILGRDDSYANYTANFAGGTLDVIQRIRVRNLGATTGIATCIAGT